jgi:NhaP-type Na+/H+ or K+/H+ antiporter
MTDITSGFALVAAVLIVAPLASGLVDRSPLSFAFLFLGLGLLIGEGGIDLLSFGTDSPLLEILATITLSLVLFLDAVKLQVDELRRRWLIPVLILGPGTALVIVLGAFASAWLLGFSVTCAVLAGAILASTDPVILREVLRDGRIPRSIRQVLRIEAGMNDLVVLPVVLIMIAVATDASSSTSGWFRFGFDLAIVGPVLGFVIGGVGSWSMFQLDRRMTIRRELQALYGIGLVLGSYTGATALGGDGFLAAFFAGLAVVSLNQSLCDCFLDYGDVTAEMAMLLSFLMFGIVLSGILSEIDLWKTAALAALVIFIIRPISLAAVLSRAHISWEGWLFTSWFGPRGLNSLLLALLVVQAGIEGSELLLAVVGTVVLASSVIHGASATPIAAWYGRRISSSVHEEERESDAAAVFGTHSEGVARISVQDLHERMESGESPYVLDVRARASYEGDSSRIPGDIRVLPDQIADWAIGKTPDRPVVLYCA